MKRIFKVKRNVDGSAECLEARLVAKEYSQCPGFDFYGNLCPTVYCSAVRTILALAGLEDVEIHSLDISNAYPNGVLEEEVYMQLPEGFEDLRGWLVNSTCWAGLPLMTGQNITVPTPE